MEMFSFLIKMSFKKKNRKGLTCDWYTFNRLTDCIRTMFHFNELESIFIMISTLSVHYVRFVGVCGAKMTPLGTFLPFMQAKLTPTQILLVGF